LTFPQFMAVLFPSTNNCSLPFLQQGSTMVGQQQQQQNSNQQQQAGANSNNNNNNSLLVYQNNYNPVFSPFQIPNLQHLSITVGTINANLLFTPEGETVLQREKEIINAILGLDGSATGGDSVVGGKGGNIAGGSKSQIGASQQGGGGGGAPTGAASSLRGGGGAGGKANQQQLQQQQDSERLAQVLFPSLTSFTIADANSKPDLISDIMQRMLVVAPEIRNWNVTNTHRQGPTALASQTVASQQRTRRPHVPRS
jgi:hypothetical protein